MFDEASKIETKTPETTNPMASIIRPGMTGWLTGLSWRVYFIMNKLVIVDKTAIPNLAMNINTSAKPSTNPNFALFFNIKMNAFRAEEQKLSEEIAM